MVALTDYLLYVRPEVSDCPEMQLRDAVLRAAIDFCKRTGILHKSFDIVTVAGQAAYAVVGSLDAGTEIHEIVYVKRPDAVYPLDPSSAADFEEQGWDDTARASDPSHYYLDGQNIMLGPVPSGIETLKVKVHIRPTSTATTLPDAIGGNYREIIAHGAKAILMAMRNKPWTDPEGAALNAGLFDSFIDRERVRIARGASKKPLRVKSHFF